MEDMNQLYSDIILEHNQDQANKHELDPHNLQEHGHNPSCGDDITLQADIQDGIRYHMPGKSSSCSMLRLPYMTRMIVTVCGASANV